MLSIKINFNDENRRVQVHTVANSDFSYPNLIETSRNLFPDLRQVPDATLIFSWVDCDNDSVLCSSDAEVKAAVQEMSEQSGLVKFNLKLQSKAKASQAPNLNVHDHVTCDGCGLSPIVGNRYKCSVREDFDLCEKCECAQPQPYPMVKIYAKEQAPAGIFIALRDHQHQHHHHRHHPHPHGRDHHHPHLHHHRGEGRRWGEGHCGAGADGKWRRFKNFHTFAADSLYRQQYKKYFKMLSMFPEEVVRQKLSVVEKFSDEEIDKIIKTYKEMTAVERQEAASDCPVGAETHFLGPLFAAARAFAETVPGSVASQNTPYVNLSEPGPGDEAQLEQQLLDEAMRQSLNDDAAVPEAAPVQRAAPTQSALASAGDASLDKSSYFQPFVPHASGYTHQGAAKPMARFIKDVSLPDGSTVFPGSEVTKTWRIRNDGQVAWPEGVVLTFSSGDLLAASQNDLTSAVAALKPGDEADISVRLTIPEATGRHVTYFRLRTKEGNIFGQRLWADVRVVEPEGDWVGINEPQLATAAASASAAVSEIVSAMSTAFVAATQTLGDAHAAAANPPATPVNQPAAPVNQPTQAPETAAPNPTEVWSKVWAKELQVLRDMGFTDAAQLIPLLQEHVGLPVSLCPELNGTPPAEGMQRLVAALLGRSGIANQG